MSSLYKSFILFVRNKISANLKYIIDLFFIKVKLSPTSYFVSMDIFVLVTVKKIANVFFALITYFFLSLGINHGFHNSFFNLLYHICIIYWIYRKKSIEFEQVFEDVKKVRFLAVQNHKTHKRIKFPTPWNVWRSWVTLNLFLYMTYI